MVTIFIWASSLWSVYHSMFFKTIRFYFYFKQKFKKKLLEIDWSPLRTHACAKHINFNLLQMHIMCEQFCLFHNHHSNVLSWYSGCASETAYQRVGWENVVPAAILNLIKSQYNLLSHTHKHTYKSQHQLWNWWLLSSMMCFEIYYQ